MHHIHIAMDTNENIQQFIVELVGQVCQQMLPLKSEEKVKLNENKKTNRGSSFLTDFPLYTASIVWVSKFFCFLIRDIIQDIWNCGT